jgi:hypothetical protein
MSGTVEDLCPVMKGGNTGMGDDYLIIYHDGTFNREGWKYGGTIDDGQQNGSSCNTNHPDKMSCLCRFSFSNAT